MSERVLRLPCNNLCVAGRVFWQHILKHSCVDACCTQCIAAIVNFLPLASFSGVAPMTPELAPSPRRGAHGLRLQMSMIINAWTIVTACCRVFRCAHLVRRTLRHAPVCAAVDLLC
jgi:hypothetical protein